MKVEQNSRKVLKFILPLLFILLLLPSIIRSVIEKRVWPFDEAWYGQNATGLFFTLTQTPDQWLTQMLHILGTKPPGLVWLGQFFTPLGIWLNSIDTGLLFSINFLNFISLFLIFSAIRIVTKGNILVAVSGSLLMASAPLFVAFSHQYFVEPIQLLGVTWFIFIMAAAPQWKSSTILLQLILATCFVMLAKFTSAIYCFAPGLVALGSVNMKELIPPHLTLKDILKAQKSQWFLVLGIIILLPMTLGWYVYSIPKVLNHISIAYNSKGYGEKAPFFIKLGYWTGQLQKSFILPSVGIILGVIAFVALFYFVKRVYKGNPKFKIQYLDICALTSLITLTPIIILSCLSAVEEPRYLLPLAPYISVILAWIMMQIDRKVVSWFVIILLVIQFSRVHLISFGYLPWNDSISHWLKPIDQAGNDYEKVEAILDNTCHQQSYNHYNIVGVELSWLNANSMEYFVNKKLRRVNDKCYYTSLGYAETDQKKAWQRIQEFKPAYFITLKPELHPNPPTYHNAVNLPILKQVESSPQFELDYKLDQGNILIFKNRQ